MNAVAEKSGKVFSMMYNQRTNPYFLRLHELVKSGELGELRRMTWIVTNWYRSQSYYDSSDWRATWDGEGGGIMINQCPHNLDMWQWICGVPNRIRSFCQFGRYHTIEVEDSVTVYLPSLLLLELGMNFCLRPSSACVRLRPCLPLSRDLSLTADWNGAPWPPPASRLSCRCSFWYGCCKKTLCRG